MLHVVYSQAYSTPSLETVANRAPLQMPRATSCTTYLFFNSKILFLFSILCTLQTHRTSQHWTVWMIWWHRHESLTEPCFHYELKIQKKNKPKNCTNLLVNDVILNECFLLSAMTLQPLVNLSRYPPGLPAGCLNVRRSGKHHKSWVAFG